MKRAMVQMSFEAAKVIGVIGGLVLLISGLLSFALPIVAVGLVAIAISRQVKHLMWSAVIIVVGVVAYTLEGGGSLWSYGPILVVVAGVIAIITHVL
jgi:hypothetical protein